MLEEEYSCQREPGVKQGRPYFMKGFETNECTSVFELLYLFTVITTQLHKLSKGLSKKVPLNCKRYESTTIVINELLFHNEI